MIEQILGSINKERILIYLVARSEGYSREIARFFETDLAPVQNQMEKLETGGVLFSKTVGRTRVYMFNPRYPFLKELKEFIEKVLEFYPEQEKNKLLMIRRRPRRAGKPL